MTRPRPTERAGRRGIPCTHCGYPIRDHPHRSEEGRAFCSTYCLEAFDEEEPTPAESTYQRFDTGVEPLDSLVPTGLPSNALVLITGDEGTRRSELLTELAWRALEREEPAVVVSYTDPPTAVLERFFALGWNPLPHLEDDRLRILDCFTHRLEERDGFESTLNEWNRFLDDAADDAVLDVRDPSDVREVANVLDGALADLDATETGIVVLDSLDEIDTMIQNRLVHQFVTEVRATVSKARYVPLVAGATTAGEDGYPANDEYVYDGIVDLRLSDSLVPGSRFPQLGVRKLVGTPFDPRWITYDGAPGRGLFSADPTTRDERPEGRQIEPGAAPRPTDRR